MKNLLHIYKTNLSLLTDLYQITMAYGYWKTGIAQQESVFHLFYRKNPFGGKYAIASGLEQAIEYLQNLHFSEADVSYLGSLKGANDKALFDEHFLNFLQRFRFSCDVEAVPEGTIVFPHEPIMRIKGPLWQANLVETTLLNIINFSTLIATKASRVVQAAAGDTVLEFGLRRAQGIDGGLTASRAAYIGGCHATSNVAAGQLFKIPVKGTHAHSWVMAFENETTAFEAYANAMPNNVTLLVDTFDTIDGVAKAIEVMKNEKAQSADFQGIRLDSGDLAPLSISARKMLDEAGFEQTKIVASNDLDEYEIKRLKEAGARIDVWGVGTKLVTAYDQPALGGVYKLAAIRPNAHSDWDFKMKFSEDPIKISNPGILQVRRNILSGEDRIFCETDAPDMDGVNLLEPVFRDGKLVYKKPSIADIRAFSLAQQALFDEKTLKNYRVSLDNKLILRKENFIANAQNTAR